MDILKNILRSMANDGRSTSTAQKIMELAKEGRLPGDISAVIRDLDKSDGGSLQLPPVLRVIRETSFLFIGFVLPLYYLLTCLALLPYFFLGLFRGKEYEELMDKESWEILFAHWGKYPNSFLIKAIEAFYFRSKAIENPSLEIGVYQGDTSKAVFHKRKLNVGTEFVPLHLLRFASEVPTTHEYLLSGDIYDIPFMDETFSSLFIIHSLDDIQRGADGALKECSRVLSPGGKLVFSTYSGYFGDQNIFLRLLKACGLNSLAQKFFSFIYIGTDNIFNENKWRTLLTKHNFKVESFIHFIPISVARLIDIPFRLEGYLINFFNFHHAFYAFTFPGIVRSYKRALMKILCGIWSVSFDRSGRERPGINIFVVVRKESPNHAELPSNKGEFDFKASLICPDCKSKLQDSLLNTRISSIQDVNFIVCSGCRKHYPCVSGIPILLKTASFADRPRIKNEPMVNFKNVG